jgi:hypothetical protein
MEVSGSQWVFDIPLHPKRNLEEWHRADVPRMYQGSPRKAHTSVGAVHPFGRCRSAADLLLGVCELFPYVKVHLTCYCSLCI